MTAPTRRPQGVRQRYIVRVTLAYAVFALAWIFLSDRLLGLFGDLESVAWVSTAKGVFFVLVSALAFHAALQAVPADPIDAGQADLVAAREPARLPRWLAYGVALALVGAMLMLRLALDNVVGNQPMLVLFTLPIAVAALVGGLGPGLLATVAAALLTNYYVLEPTGSLRIPDGVDLFQWSLLISNGLLVSVLSGVLHRLRARDRAHLHHTAAANEALRRSEARVQQLFDDAPQAMGLISDDGSVLALNRRFLALFGYQPGELTSLAQWWPQAYPDPAYRDEVSAAWVDKVGRARVTGTPVETSEYRVTCRDGRERNIQFDGTVLGGSVLVTLTDVTERREIEERLRLWAESFDRAQFGLAIGDARSNRFVAVNPAFARDRGWRPEDLVGESVATVFPPELLPQVLVQLRELDQQGHGVLESEHVTRDGRRFPVLLDFTVLRDERGEPTRRVVYALDLSERRHAEQALAMAQAQALEQQTRARIAALNQMQDANLARNRAESALRALRESEGRLALFVEHAPAALAMFDREMHYVAVSRRWLDDYSLGAQNLVGRSHYEVFPELTEEVREVHRRALAGEVVSKTEDRFVRSNGTVHWLRWEVHPWRFDDGQIGGIVLFTEDVSARKAAEEGLQRLNATLEARVAERTAQLEALNQSLESFVYSVSHDLKAPLRGVEGYSRFLQEDHAQRLDEEGQLFVANIRSGVARMGELIDDLLTYSRMERRKLHSDVLDLGALLRRLLAEREAELAARNVQVELDLPAALSVQGDADGLALALRNLLENAIKFSARAAAPRIAITASVAQGQVTLTVRDNGIGFDMKYHDRIFEIFQRLHRLEDYPGTGIGLALVKKAIERMGGRVWAESAPGQGATFHLQVPAEASAPT
jgi:PAS domain S-box-containing protein